MGLPGQLVLAGDVKQLGPVLPPLVLGLSMMSGTDMSCAAPR